MAQVSKTLATMTTTFLVAGEDADMVIGFQSGDMYLALQRELPIGSPISVAYWLKDEYKAEGDGINLLCPLKAYPTFSLFQAAYNVYKKEAAAKKTVDEIRKLDLYKKVSKHLEDNNIPPAALNIMISAILAEVVLTDLIFQRKTETINSSEETTTKAKLGLAINFAAPLVLLPNLAVRKIVLLIMYASNGVLDFPLRDTKLPSPEPVAIPAKGSIDFKDHTPAANDTITLGTSEWKFVTGPGDTSTLTTGIVDNEEKEVTLGRLVTDLNKSENVEISKCKYKLDGTKLMITAQVAGKDMNEFKLAAKAKADKVTPSAATLTGGVGELKENKVLEVPKPPK